MNTRPPPPQGRFGFNRTYRTNLRPVIIGGAGAVLLHDFQLTWSYGIEFFRSIDTDKDDGVPKLATFAIVVGAIYMGLFVIECIGVLAAATQRLALVRTYAYLSLAAIALTVVSGLLQVVVHFTLKSDIISECTTFAEGSNLAVYPFGLWGPSRHESLDPQDASDFCNNAWSQGSWQNIISLLITIFLACSFSVLAWGYYRQLLDPTSVVNQLRAPSNQVHLVNYPSHYNPPYNASVPNLGYAYGAPPPPMYGPPPGAPPPRDATFSPPQGKPPGFDEGVVGYGVDDKENPFADFDERTERDVTSRPVPGGRDAFP
ncbi:hypothetical protein DFH07DRAFT_811755 [Mycena maculata]|uniref:Uncharacterized protein n=1 Tax=Mycena maculata TaxID=230809 RepID=A0AAD7JGT5_9AGAR|nr:hypothetical protein DFH07DRAFT_811755 [Mycena maculata]